MQPPWSGSAQEGGERFEPTRWSVVLAAGQEVAAPASAQAAPAELCRTWLTVTVRSHVNRLRVRYRKLLRAELRRTVQSDEEVHELLHVLATR